MLEGMCTQRFIAVNYSIMVDYPSKVVNYSKTTKQRDSEKQPLSLQQPNYMTYILTSEKATRVKRHVLNLALSLYTWLTSRKYTLVQSGRFGKGPWDFLPYTQMFFFTIAS